MKSASKNEWQSGFVPRGLRESVVFRRALLLVGVVGVVGVGLGVVMVLMGPLGNAAPAKPAVPVYMVILVATGWGVLFGSMIWSAASLPITDTDWSRAPEDEVQLAPPHRQRWTYRSHQAKPIGATIVAAVWNLVGLAAFWHYVSRGGSVDPRVAWPFLVYGVCGLIPLTLAIRGWARVGGGSRDMERGEHQASETGSASCDSSFQ